jgi:hypothetical protein
MKSLPLVSETGLVCGLSSTRKWLPKAVKTAQSHAYGLEKPPLTYVRGSVSMAFELLIAADCQDFVSQAYAWRL